METDAIPSPDPVHVKGAGILPGPPPVHVPDDPDGIVLQDAPERWVVVLVVDREDTGPDTLPGDSPPDAPIDWPWAHLVGARTEVVTGARLEAGVPLRVETGSSGDGAVWIELEADGEVTW